MRIHNGGGAQTRAASDTLLTDSAKLDFSSVSFGGQVVGVAGVMTTASCRKVNDSRAGHAATTPCRLRQPHSVRSVRTTYKGRV